MIKIDITMPSRTSLVRAAMVQVEKKLAEKARRAAVPYGGVAISFRRNPDGSIRSIDFKGSDAAVKAASNAVAR